MATSTKLLSFSKTLGLAGGLVTVTDLMQPIAPFSAYLIALSGISALLLLITRFISKTWNETLSVSLTFSFLVLCLSSGLYFWQKNQPHESLNKSVIASNVPILEKLQKDLGIIATNTRMSAKSLASIDEKIDSLKKETSHDPRKELANMGLKWDEKEFLYSIQRGDLDIVELYLKGGMSVDVEHYAILPVRLSLNKSNVKDMYSLLRSYNFDINKAYSTEMISGIKTITPLAAAIMYDNYELIALLVDDGVNYHSTFEAFDTRTYSRKFVSIEELMEQNKTPMDIRKLFDIKA